MTLQEISPEKIVENPFHLMSKQWVLITAGTSEKYNMMTAGWGTLGILWSKPVTTMYVRPSRYTYEFMESNETYSITAFSQEYRKMLNICGTKSGRDINKMDMEGLTPVDVEGTVYFAEAELAIICKKIYHHDLIPNRVPQKVVSSHYDSGDFHRVYYGEILKCYHK